MNEAERFLEERQKKSPHRAPEVSRESHSSADDLQPSVEPVINPSAASPAPPAKPTPGRYGLAILACIATFVGFHILGAIVFGWKHGGGYVGLVISFALVVTVWKTITTKR